MNLKYIVEKLLGRCWHEWKLDGTDYVDHVELHSTYTCTKCLKDTVCHGDPHRSNPTPDGNFQQECIQALKDKGEWKSFELYCMDEAFGKARNIIIIFTDLDVFFETLEKYINED